MSTFKSIFNSYVSSKLRGQHCAIPYYLYIFFYRFSVVLVQIISGMREISILKVLFTTSVSMPESVCG